MQKSNFIFNKVYIFVINFYLNFKKQLIKYIKINFKKLKIITQVFIKTKTTIKFKTKKLNKYFITF